MTDVGWPFYGLDERMQPDISASGYFDGLSAMVGLDLLESLAAALLGEPDGGGAALRPESEKTAGGVSGGLMMISGFEPEDAAISRYPLPPAWGQDAAPPERETALAGGLDLWTDTLRAAETSGDDGLGWANGGMGRLGVPDGQDEGAHPAARSLTAGGAGWQMAAATDGGRFTDPVSRFFRTDAGGAADGGSLGEALDTAQAGVLWQKAAQAGRADFMLGAAPFDAQSGGKNSVPITGGSAGRDASGADALIPLDMLWSDAEDRLLDRLERRLGIEIANGTEGAFG